MKTPGKGRPVEKRDLSNMMEKRDRGKQPEFRTKTRAREMKRIVEEMLAPAGYQAIR